MKVYENSPKPGRIWSIEVSSHIGRRSLARVIATIPGVLITQKPSLFSQFRDAPFCSFELGKRRFKVEAIWPAGDRFEISPDPSGCAEELLVIRDALLAHAAGGA
jgi:hypothetical protein